MEKLQFEDKIRQPCCLFGSQQLVDFMDVGIICQKQVVWIISLDFPVLGGNSDLLPFREIHQEFLPFFHEQERSCWLLGQGFKLKVNIIFLANVANLKKSVKKDHIGASGNFRQLRRIGKSLKKLTKAEEFM